MKMKKLKYLIDATLPKNHLISSSSILLGAIIGGISFNVNSALLLLGALVINFGWLGAGNVINMVADLEIDKINLPNRPLPSGKITVKETVLFYFTLIFISVFLSILINKWLLIVVSFGVLLGILYSFRPFRLKQRYLLSNLSIALAYGVISFMCGFLLINTDLTNLPLWIFVFLLFMDMGGSMTKDYKDIEGDTLFNMRTVPVVHGRKNAVVIHSTFLCAPYIVVVVFALIGAIPISYSLLIFSLLFAFYILRLLTKSKSKKEDSTAFFYIILLATLTRLLLIGGWYLARWVL